MLISYNKIYNIGEIPPFPTPSPGNLSKIRYKNLHFINLSGLEKDTENHHLDILVWNITRATSPRRTLPLILFSILPWSALAAAWANCSRWASKSGSFPSIVFIAFSNSSSLGAWPRLASKRALSEVSWDEAVALVLPWVFTLAVSLLSSEAFVSVLLVQSNELAPFCESACDVCFAVDGVVFSKSSRAPWKEF